MKTTKRPLRTAHQRYGQFYVSATLPPLLYFQLQAAAERDGTSVSATIRELLAVAVEQKPHADAK